MPPRVLLVGVTGWHARFLESCSEALVRLGAEVSCAPSADYRRLYDRSLAGRIARKITRPRSAAEEYPDCVHRIVQAARQGHDVLVVVGGSHHLSSASLNRIRQAHRGVLAIWFYDDPFTDWDSDSASRTGALNASDCFDRTFVFDSYHIPKLLSWGFRRVSHLPLCANDALYRPVDLTEHERLNYAGDVVFIGLATPEREAALRRCLDFNLRLVGPNWTLPELRSRVVAPHVSAEEANKLYQACKVAVNVNHKQSIYGSNCRTYEIPCSGTLALVDRKKDVERQFLEGEEMVFFDREEDIPVKLQDLLADAGRAAMVAQQGHRRAVMEHTFVARMKKLLADCGQAG